MRFRVNEELKFSIDKFKDIYTAVIITLGYGLFTFAWSADSNLTTIGIVPWIAGWVVAILQFVSVDTDKDLNAVICDLHIYYIVLMFIAWQELNTETYLYTTSADYLMHKNDFMNPYPVAGYYNTNNFAYILCVLFPFSLYDLFFGRMSKLPLIKYFLLVGELVLFFWLIINTTSRLAIITLVVFIVFILLYNTQNLKESKWPLVLVVLALSLMIGLISIGAFGSQDMSLKEFFEKQFDSTINPEPDSDAKRFRLIEAAFKIFLNKPFGVGVGLSSEFTDDFVEGITKDMPIHNMFLIILVEFGIVGAVGYCYIFLRTTIGIWKNRLKSALVNTKTGFILATIVCFVLMSMCPSNATNFPFTFLLFGVWLSFFKIYREVPDELTLIASKRSSRENENVVGFYNAEVALREREEFLRQRKLKRLKQQHVNDTTVTHTNNTPAYRETVKPIYEEEPTENSSSFFEIMKIRGRIDD